VGYNVRPFRTEDRGSLARAIDAVCGESRWMQTARFEPTPAWQHALQKPGCGSHLLLVAEARSEVVGWCRLFPVHCPDSQFVGDRGIALHEQGLELGIGLLPAFRRQGLGCELVESALGWARAAALPAIYLTTRRGNVRALGLFARCGFVDTSKAGDEEVAMWYNMEQAHGVDDARGGGQGEHDAK
jgi:GNAT superfamily N-acetyltransferase